MRHRLALGRDRFAVRFHLQLLEVERQQAEPLIVGEDGARLTLEPLDVEPVGEGRDQRHVLRRLGKAEMPVHLGRAFEQGLESVPAEGQRGGDSDRAPHRVATADAFPEHEHAGFIDAVRDRGLRCCRDGDYAAVRVGNPAFAQPLARGFQIRQRFQGGECLGCDHDERRCGVERLDRFVERRAVDVGQKAHVERCRAAAQCVDHQCRPKDRAADADMQDPAELPECSRLGRVDQGPHSLPPRGREVDLLGCTAAALGDVRRCAAFARIDDVAGKQCVALGREAHLLGASDQIGDRRFVEMRLAPVEIQASGIEGEPAEPRRLGLEQFGEGGRTRLLQLR